MPELTEQQMSAIMPACTDPTNWTAALSAAWFWKAHGLNELADDQNDDDDTEDFVTITKRINGGTNGLKERMAFWARAKTVLPG